MIVGVKGAVAIETLRSFIKHPSVTHHFRDMRLIQLTWCHIIILWVSLTHSFYYMTKALPGIIVITSQNGY